jgi:hypothetical protein
MAVLTRDTQDQYVAMRPHLPDICLVVTSSAVRHLCFDMFSAIGYEVYVFYSPETFIRSGAAASVDILVLRHTRICLEENEPLRWVGRHRPHIKRSCLGMSQLSSIDFPTYSVRPQSPVYTKGA